MTTEPFWRSLKARLPAPRTDAEVFYGSPAAVTPWVCPPVAGTLAAARIESEKFYGKVPETTAPGSPSSIKWKE